MNREVLNCRKCGHQWFTRGDQAPVACPRCRTKYWKVAPVPRLCKLCQAPTHGRRALCQAHNLIQMLNKENKPPRTHYEIQDLEIGETRQFPFSSDINKNISMTTAIEAAAKRAGKQFAFMPEAGYLTIRRIS